MWRIHWECVGRVKHNCHFSQGSATFAALPQPRRAARPTQQLTELGGGRCSPPQPAQPVSLLLADFGICQHGLEAWKQAACRQASCYNTNSGLLLKCQAFWTSVSSYTGQYSRFVFSVMANPGSLKGEAGGNSWGKPSRRASAELFCQYKFVRGARSTGDGCRRWHCHGASLPGPSCCCIAGTMSAPRSWNPSDREHV